MRPLCTQYRKKYRTKCSSLEYFRNPTIMEAICNLAWSHISMVVPVSQMIFQPGNYFFMSRDIWAHMRNSSETFPRFGWVLWIPNEFKHYNPRCCLSRTLQLLDCNLYSVTLRQEELSLGSRIFGCYVTVAELVQDFPQFSVQQTEKKLWRIIESSERRDFRWFRISQERKPN